VSSGGFEYVFAGGSASGTVISNSGVAIDLGTASGTMVLSGGTDIVEAGATETGAMVSSGGNQTVLGTANGTVLSTGGIEYVLAGGTASGITISGGYADVLSGGIVSGTVTFVSGGELVLHDSVAFGGLVAGFAVPDSLDLVDIPYVSGTTTLSWTQLTSGANASGTLTVSEGGHTANITLLGQYMAANFAIQSDGQGGTLVTDPPAGAPTDPHPLVLTTTHHV
jgi:autotransporter passenger strand-loop-strand repeat protein